MKKYKPYVKNIGTVLFWDLFYGFGSMREFILPYINANIINIGAANRIFLILLKMVC